MSKEKLLKTIKNPNVNKVKKNRAKKKLIKLDAWKDDYEKFINMASTELYEYHGIKHQ